MDSHKCSYFFSFIFVSIILKAIHNKDYSVVKTFSASTTFGAFLLELSSLIHQTFKII